ncbi:glycosyltransferase [Streptomyces sp. NPDC059256]|uniref:glycosyltransferase n=1 Tax=Streptomyces sp. NPDC059256 TaxID=3346794 RepID=UPI00367F9001
MPQRSRTEPSPPTILHLVQPVEGGVARVVIDLVKAQTEEGLRAVVACPSGGELASAVESMGVPVHRWQAGRAPGPRLAREVFTAARLIRGLAPDLVHAHSAKAGLVARLAVRGRIPTVFQPHAWSFDAVGPTGARLALAWERHGARWSTRTLCVSESERRAGQAAGIDTRWTVIHNGIDLKRFNTDHLDNPDHPDRPYHPDRADLSDAGEGKRQLGLKPRDLSGIPADAPLVLCVGRLCRQKGQDVLLAAWPRITAAVPSAHLVLLGDGPERERLTRTAPPHVTFAGASPDVRPWLHTADLMVLPSRWEGMALAPLEAMACGLPVVVTDVSGARESLPPGQETHGLVPPDDPRALADAVIALLRDPVLRTALGRQAHGHTRTTRDFRATAAAVSGLYQDLLNSPHTLTRKSATR